MTIRCYLLKKLLEKNSIYSKHKWSRDVKCMFQKDSISGVIEGLEGIDDFDLFVNRCGYKDIKTISYRKCYVGYVILPITKIKQNYPSLKNLFWNCKGICLYNKAENINIHGCHKGRIF